MYVVRPITCMHLTVWCSGGSSYVYIDVCTPFIFMLVEVL